MKERLKKLKVAELKELASDCGISIKEKHKKDEFVAMLLEESYDEIVREYFDKRDNSLLSKEEQENPSSNQKESSQQEQEMNSTRHNLYDKKEYERIIQDKDSATAEGILEILPDGFGFLRGPNYISTENDVYVSPAQIRRFNMKTGDKLLGIVRPKNKNERFDALLYVKSVNGIKPDIASKRKDFEKLVPIYPDTRLKLAHCDVSPSVRLVDIFTPIGKGQRGLIVAPPKAGKTTLLKQIANAILKNHSEVELIVLLIDERPEEVTDIRESVQADVISSTFDELPSNHIKVAEMVLARAKNLVEHGRDVVILMDSITRLARAYNLTIVPTGRTLSGGLDPGALYGPKKFFGAARNVRAGGSLTILATALIDTGSRMDDMIYEEFKGTGNMELHLDRKLAEKRLFPAMDIDRSGTRKEELLLDVKEYEKILKLRRILSNKSSQEAIETVLRANYITKDTDELLDKVLSYYEK
ncbi:transcription termination factor Rho [Filifactor alocis ATCC 35896]|uniref:Transcription termination factor Rho n=1 Tax=Filifactor alocis (strain ATCC 35896 / CCUG 47790 / D40 B5) TaxID=546269 RepID=D6GTU2_FILAD|nr:transcription termination factor Rho [Filifactor alocis]EFE27613.1 transcription termination factor Rho [Filifactor alocis ATCC 35896]